jgi:DNA-directed RNA polymerase alpha subunit
VEHLLLSCIESRVENNRSFYGRFQLGPFDLGQGLTVATALRRTLLSELTGLAITAVAIRGASHEYSTLCGVRESVLDILLNLKQIVFSFVDSELESDSSQNLANQQSLSESQIGFLKVSGPGIVKARDIKLPSSIQCVDPDQYIATLASNGTLEIRFIISEGKNYIIQTISPSELPSPLSQQHFSNRALNLVASTDPRVLQSPQFSLPNQSLVEKTKNSIKAEVTSKEESRHFQNLKIGTFSSDSNGKAPTMTNLNGTSINAQTLNSNKLEQSKELDSNLAFSSTKGLTIKMPGSQTSSNSPGVVQSSSTTKKVAPISLGATNPFISEINGAESNLLSKRHSITKSSTEFLKIDKMTNILLIDAVFMPVNRVNFLLENDDESIELKEKVILEIWTNGSIHPRKAIHEAASAIIRILLPFQEIHSFQSSILNSHLKSQQNSPGVSRRQEFYSNKKKVKFAAKKDNLAIKKNRAFIDIGNLELSLRPYTCLKRANINTVNDLLQYSSDELLLLKNFGKRSLEEVETTLAQLGLKLGKPNSNQLLKKI